MHNRTTQQKKTTTCLQNFKLEIGAKIGTQRLNLNNMFGLSNIGEWKPIVWPKASWAPAALH